MAKKNKGKVIKKRKDYLTFLKQLTRWICSYQRNKKTIQYLLDQYETTPQNIFIRIVSYCYNKPHIIWYFNKYFNNLYDFFKYDIIELMYSMVYIMDCNDHNKTQQLFYLKSNNLKDTNKQKVKNIIKEYFNIIKKEYPNDLELNFYYKLFQTSVISPDEILQMDLELNGKESKITFSDIDGVIESTPQASVESINKYIEDCKIRILPSNISQFCNELKSNKLNRKECQRCKLKDNSMVVLDTNMSDFGPVDIIYFVKP